MKIWAHRGCSQKYPENTIMAFTKAIEIQGLTGIELDIQMTRDRELVVIHDERVDRTTDGIGYVKDFTYTQIRQLSIAAGVNKNEQIPSMDEVLDCLQDKMKAGFLLNIELKNSVITYDGMEEKILDLITKRGLQNCVVFSSFYAKSLEKMRTLEQDVSIGILDHKVSDCLYKKNGGCGRGIDRVALHPFWKGMDIPGEHLQGQTVRAWFTGHLYPEKSTGTILDLKRLEDMGITDVFLNEPEVYLEQKIF